MSDESLADNYFLVDDVVALKSDPSRLGIVEQTPYDSDAEDTSVASSGDTEGTNGLGVPHKHVLVSIEGAAHGLGTLYKDEDLVLVDRTFLPGDIVMADDTQLGQVLDSTVEVTLQFNARVSPNASPIVVDSRDVEPLLEYQVGETVIYKNLVGEVDEVNQILLLELDDKQTTIVRNSTDPEIMPYEEHGEDDLSDSSDIMSETDSEPESEPRRGSQEMEDVEDSDSDTDAPSVSSLICDSDSDDDAYYFTGDVVDVRLLSENEAFMAAYEEQGFDPNLLEKPATVKRAEIGSIHVKWMMKNPQRSGIELSDGEACRKGDSTIKAEELTNGAVKKLFGYFRHTKVEIGKLVRIRGQPTVYGITKTCTRVDVIWQDATREYRIPATTLRTPLHFGEDDLLPRTYVTDTENKRTGLVVAVNHKERIARVKWVSADGKHFSEPEDLSSYRLKEHEKLAANIGDLVLVLLDPPTGSVISMLGEVVDRLEDGKLRVALMVDDKRSIISDYHPENLVVMEEDLVSGEFDMWEDTEDEDDVEQIIREELRAMDYATTRSQESTAEVPLLPELDEASAVRPLANDAIEPSLKDVATFELVPSEPPANHRFTGAPSNLGNQNYQKRIQQELRILHTSLPSSGIFVRCFESRMDLFRVLYIGSKHTPYQDMPFLFDIQMPSNFPFAPPLVHFWSMAGRLNPNLYENGRVCLSLLGTWEGTKESETWNERCTMLQVLLSIQGLVLNKYPYYNEAGYESHKRVKTSLASAQLYNERAYLLSMQSLVLTLQQRESFEPFTAVLTSTYLGEHGLLASSIIPMGKALLNSGGGAGEERHTGENELGLVSLSAGAKNVLQATIGRLEQLLN